jgi:hypothetical protein
MRPGTPRSLLWIATGLLGLAARDVRLLLTELPDKHQLGLVEGAKNTAVV